MSIFESHTIEQNFESLKEDIDKLKNITIKKIKNLELTTQFRKIQRFESLWLSSISVRIMDGNYCSGKELRLDFDRECFDYLYNNHKKLIDNFQYDKSWHYLKMMVNENNKDKLDLLKSIIEAVYEKDFKIHKENLTKLDSNKKLKENLFGLLKQIGISEKHYDFPSNRSRKKDWINYHWVSEISSQIPTSYPENKCEELKNNIFKKIDELYHNELKRIKEEQLKKEREQKEKERNKILALLLAKYDLELTDTWDQLLETIINKNKYLKLAHYLEQNRSDWNNGSWYAECGLENFKIETDLDKEIYREISSLINEWQGDGRVFRDCEYNYSVLYKIAENENSELCKDYWVVRENTPY